MRFIHAADIHLDSPLLGLKRYEGAPHEELRSAVRQALMNLITLAVQEEVDFLLIAGDLYDGDWQDYNTGLFFAKQMNVLREKNIRVYIVSGNHDAQSIIARNLQLPDNVSIFPTDAPITIVDEELGVAIHGQSYAKPAITDNLAAAYPQRVAGMLNIGLLHTNVDGQQSHDNYAPCRLEELRNKGYDYWALGHVHSHAILSEEPWVVYAGNVQGRHAREIGAKGCVLVTAVDRRVTTVEFAELDVARWDVCRVDAEGCESPYDVLERVRAAMHESVARANGRLLAARIEITGACEAHNELIANAEEWDAQIRLDATNYASSPVWIEKIHMGTRVQHRLEDMAQRDDAIGDLLRSMNELRDDDRVRELIAQLTEELVQRFSYEVRASLDNSDAAELIEDVRHMLISRLLSSGGAS